MTLSLGLWIALQGCVVPWVEPTDDESDTDVDPTDDTEAETDTETDGGGGGSDVELYEACADAEGEPLLQDGTYSGTFRGADTSGLNPDCASIAPAEGQDLYRRVRVAAGKKLTIELQAADRDVVITLLSACDTTACQVGADSALEGGLEKLTYTNTGDAPEDFILGLHLFDESERGGDFTLTVLREDD